VGGVNDLVLHSMQILRAILDYIHKYREPREAGVDFVKHSIEDAIYYMMVKGTLTG